MNDEAIGNITLAIQSLLTQGLQDDWKVTLSSPWNDFAGEGINLFLYKVIENAQWKNMDWLGDRSNPTKIAYPPLSLDIFYLLTPYASETKDNEGETEIALIYKILGKAMRILHENPVLNSIHNSDFDADNDAHFAADIRNSFEKIKITLNPIDTDEMSKIWSMGDKPYRLSVAYHVSLVQIAPTVPTKPVAAPVQETALKVTTLEPPLITKLDPSNGPVGTELHIIGEKLWLKGFKTIVNLGGSSISDSDFTSKDENEIVLTVHNDLMTGPDQNITVVTNGRESKPELFKVSPWISRIKPQRGAIDANNPHAVPIDIHGYDLMGNVQLEIGGSVVADTDIKVVDENLIETYIPSTLGNGEYDIDLKINGNSANTRKFEVVPLIQSFSPSAGQAEDSIAMNGQRLQGDQIRISIGPAIITKATNANPNQLSFNVPKTLTPGDYTVKIAVSGHDSNPKTFNVIA